MVMRCNGENYLQLFLRFEFFFQVEGNISNVNSHGEYLKTAE